ncbi:MAG TPA: ribosome biogenesis factor YjgA [Burkholderiales bacterium]|nr:ribosome biogenesis factor YjgA [Burkholderiales bacterium]
MQDEIVSKTRKKREMHERQALGVALVELSETQLKSMALADDLLQAVVEAKRIKSHEAKRRQMQYIGRLMRDIDPAAIRSRLGEIEGNSAQASAAHRRLETWRERLLADDAALTAFAAEHPGADLQTLRTLIRNSRKQLQEGNRARAYRDLFRLIRQCSSNPS